MGMGDRGIEMAAEVYEETAPESEPCGPAVEVNGIRQDCEMGVFDNALDHADLLVERGELEPTDPAECFAKGAMWGAGWGAAIVGMFEAIRKNAPRVKRCSSCGYDPFRDGDHPNDAYDNTIYKCEGGLFCGECADQLGECDVDDD